VGTLAVVCSLTYAGFDAALAGCSSTSSGAGAEDGGPEDSAPDQSTPDASPDTGGTDGTTTEAGGGDVEVSDSGPTDAGSAGDSPAEGAVDAPTTVTETFNSTGQIFAAPYGVSANFFLNDDIVRFSDAPQCVMRFRNANTSTYACVGNLILGGDTFGQDGGPPAGAIDVPCGSTNGSYAATPTGSWLFFPETGDTHFQISTDGTGTGIPDIPVTTLHTPAFSQINFTQPLELDGGACNAGGFTIQHNQPFQVQWTVPDAGVSDQRVAVSLYQIFSSSPGVFDTADIWCGYPLSDGQATVPAELLTEVWNRLGGDAGGPLSLVVQVTAGDQREVVVNGSSFVIMVQNSSAMLFSDCAPAAQIPTTMQ
jgi:hypothetical protein